MKPEMLQLQDIPSPTRPGGEARLFADYATGNNMAIARLDRIGARGVV